MIALLGESGCGKSTTIQILQKFYEAESGKIKVNGLDFDLISTQNWRSIIGVVPQQIKLFNGSLLDNILLGETVKDVEKVTNFFKKHGFNAYFEQFPNGYATAILLLTHRISIARSAERIYILKNGKIEQSGNHKRLLETENLYTRAWRDMAIAV